MGIKAVIRDLIEKGIDPKNAVVGEDGLFTDIAYCNQPSITNEQASSPSPRNALILLNDSTEKKVRKPRKPKAE